MRSASLKGTFSCYKIRRRRLLKCQTFQTQALVIRKGLPAKHVLRLAGSLYLLTIDLLGGRLAEIGGSPRLLGQIIDTGHGRR